VNLDLFGLPLDRLGEELVKAVSPGLVALLPATAAATRQIVRVIRKRIPSIDGNLAQSVAVGVSLSVVAVTASANGVFADGTDARELAGLLLIAAINGGLATGVNEWLTDRGGQEPEGEAGE
jgi:hypothetical protein